MAFEGHQLRHREPKGCKVKSSRRTEWRGRTLAPVTNAQWHAQRETRRGLLCRLLGWGR